MSEQDNYVILRRGFLHKVENKQIFTKEEVEEEIAEILIENKDTPIEVYQLDLSTYQFLKPLSVKMIL